MHSRILRLNPNYDWANLAILAYTCTQQPPPPGAGLGWGRECVWTEDREWKWGVDNVIVPIQRESIQEGCFGGGRVFYGVHDVRGFGGVNKQRLRSGFIWGGFSGLVLCCFYSKQFDQNKEVDCWGRHSGWWVCIGSGDSAQLQLLRFENNR